MPCKDEYRLIMLISPLSVIEDKLLWERLVSRWPMCRGGFLPRGRLAPEACPRAARPLASPLPSSAGPALEE